MSTSRSMTLNQLQAFVSAATLGTFSAAAEELGVAQPSISELVRRLEEQLDAFLFVRGGRTLSLTAAGVELLPHATEAIAAIEMGAKAVSSIGSLASGTATFGVLRNGPYYGLADLVERFHIRHPDVRVRLVGLNSAETANALVEGTIEAGLLVLPVSSDQLNLTPLLEDEVFYISADPAATAEPMTVTTFAQRKLVLYDALGS